MIGLKASLLLVNAFIAALSMGMASVEGAPKILGFFSNFDPIETIKDYSGSLNIISMYQFRALADGSIKGDVDKDALAYCKGKNMEVYALINNQNRYDFDTRIGHSVLSKKAARDNFIKNAVKLVVDNGFDGANVDFEAIPKKDRTFYTTMITSLSAELHSVGKKLAISVPAIEEDSPNDSWAGAFDYEALGKQVDIFQVMAYDENGIWGKPGPVSGLDWVKNCINYAKTVVSAPKISMGINAYGYVWNLQKKNTGRYIHWVDFQQLIDKTGATVKFDAKSSSPYFYYKLKGVDYVAWIENQESIKLKAQFAKDASVGSISIWSLGYENQSYYDAINQGFAA